MTVAPTFEKCRRGYKL